MRISVEVPVEFNIKRFRLEVLIGFHAGRNDLLSGDRIILEKVYENTEWKFS